MAGAPITFPRGRELILGVSAGIAAYKSCELLRRLQDHGFLVTVIPTESSLNFVGKATWEALSGRPVSTSVWENIDSVSHVSLGDKADFLLIAPATADVIARLAQGRADDLLSTTVLATTAPILIVPAMHPKMWLNQATQENVRILRARGVTVMEPDVGRLTGKDSGIGRFPETKTIIDHVSQISGRQAFLSGKKILVTAGGTREAIDPVRFIGNHSSGRQGLAVAYEALKAGAEVTVIAGATDPFTLEGAHIIEVESAQQMKQAVEAEFVHTDALIMAAAVADARPHKVSNEKIKKNDFLEIALEKNEDILASISSIKGKHQILVGFAAETADNATSLAEGKMQAKGADFLYVNNVSGGAVFGSEKTSGTLLGLDIAPREFNDVDKFVVAGEILKEVGQRLERIHG
ncbi:MAG: bifunctional phosphopantothenoylcysteine decarboxylase/phosphopantothenate--cysteine ligase CoaBC [Candidatus Nanopelagicaceae bacterium]|jgi:phosphopantothenoylcysteine decarboxylase/phosphopantothenate--cysteine ligase|nr:bifunctional phosphopantothenoylcysteine decarboxylase/phosphopantothenate--cysteine ligase CoaBC [Candidatus Nanopelagicaceae bacterium]